jgi:hypothetical protein
MAQHFCALVLGPLDEARVKHWSRHGPGATTGNTSKFTAKYFKYSKWPYRVTPGALEHAKQMIREDPRWHGALEESYRERFSIERWRILDPETFWSNVLIEDPYNRITTVPKDYHCDRPIAIEPTLNVMLQLGVDGFIRKRLRRWGIDINSQEKNQALALEGSLGIGFNPCTIDLRSASDTISLRVVKLLLPGDWFNYMCDLRSPKGVLPDGSIKRYSKISSMGNGYTFALETLIFGALTYAASMYTFNKWMRDEISVFGDDLIVPHECVPLLTALLELFGFSINQTKSFVEGPVRESCGADWVSGTLVRPVFLKQVPEEVSHLLADRNRIHRWCKLYFHIDTPSVDSYILQFIDGVADKLSGPYSDEEFDSYWHVDTPPPNVRWENWCYHFRSLGYRTKLAKPRRKDFLFGKLSNDLRSKPVVRDCWKEDFSSVSAAGSSFDIPLRYRKAPCVRSRVASYWQREYNMLWPRSARVTAGAPGQVC